MTNENMVTVQLSLEAFGWTNKSKQELLSALMTAGQCQLVFTTAKGEEIELTSYFEPIVEHISISDEDGIEIFEDQVTY